MKAGAVILAGGKSSRMGSNKALLPINGKTNIERIKDSLDEVFSDIILVANDEEMYQFLNIPIVKDNVRDKGPLAGIEAGLLASRSETNLFVACDMPFVSTQLAEVLLANSDGYDAVVPVIAGKRHPLFAVYKRTLLDEISDCLQTNQLRIKHLLDRVNVNYLTEDQLSDAEIDKLDRFFYNMNNPAEYAEAIKIAQK